MTTSITPALFFATWAETCGVRKSVLLAKWTQAPLFTAEFFDLPNALLAEVAVRLGQGLRFYAGYYSIDAIFFTDADRVHCAPTGQTWVQNIRIAFEHENYFDSGLFTETSHLMITRAELRVLVSYPGNEGKLDAELQSLAKIIKASNLAEDPAFLFIAGERITNFTDICWRGFVYSSGAFQPLNP